MSVDVFDKTFSFFSGSQTENLYNELTLNDDDNIKQNWPLLIATNDKITCLTASEKYFIVGYQSGAINQFMLPNANCIKKIMIDSIPMRLALNRNSSKLAITDKFLKFFLYDFEANDEETWSDGNWIELKLGEIWDFMWEMDNNDLIVLAERNKLIVINLNKAVKILEPIVFHGYICQFKHLTIKTLLLEQLIIDMDDIDKMVNINDYVQANECQYVKNLKDLIENKSMTDAINYALQTPELPSLWNILSTESLNRCDIETAYLSMIKNKDYKGLQFLKRLNKLKDENLKQAEIYSYNNQFTEAEKIYLQLDRPDLAVHLNKIVGNYQRVMELLKS